MPKGETLGSALVKHLRLYRHEVAGKTGSCKHLARYHDYAIAVFAGSEAQRRFNPHSVKAFSASKDCSAINNLLVACMADGKRKSPYAFKYLQARARNLVNQPSNWRRILDLAKALLERKTLTRRRSEGHHARPSNAGNADS